MNNSDNYIFSFDEFLLANYAPFTPNSWATLEVDLRARFFSSNQKGQFKIHMIVAIWRVFLSNNVFVFYTDPRVRSFFCTVLRTKSTEIWLGLLAQATAKIIYSELVQPPLASFCCKLLNKNSWLKTLLLVFPEISGKIRKKRAPSCEIKLLRRKFFKKFKAYILVYTRWSEIYFDRAINLIYLKIKYITLIKLVTRIFQTGKHSIFYK